MRQMFLLGILLCQVLLGRELVFGITSLGIKEDLGTVYDLRAYLQGKLNQEVKIVTTKTYDDMNYLLERSKVDFAFLCSGAYVDAYKKSDIEVAGISYINDHPHYFAYIIVPHTSNAASLLDLQGKSFAFTNLKSSTGTLAPSFFLLEQGFEARRFFRDIIYTHDFTDSVRAVADEFVDGASVSSITFDAFAKIDPELIKRVKIIQTLGPFITQPIVLQNKMDKETKKALKEALLQMHHDPLGLSILERLGIDRFDAIEGKYNYEDIQTMVERLRQGK